MSKRNIRKINNEMKGRPVTSQRKLLLDLIKKEGVHINDKWSPTDRSRWHLHVLRRVKPAEAHPPSL
jgi:hypothetical protein